MWEITFHGLVIGCDISMDLNQSLRKRPRKMDDFLEAVVEEHENKMMSGGVEDDQKDFVDVLLWIQKENMIDFPMERATIKAIILVRNFLLVYLDVI